MRVPGLLPVITVVACLSPLTATAQTTAQRRAAASAAAEEQTEPYHKHRDTRHGHDHYYPDRGAIVRDLPVGTIGTSYAGVSYRYHDGIWLEPRGPAFMVVSPPLGLIAPTLPLYSTVVTHGSESLLYCNDTYYRPRPDLGGYEVVNDPAMEAGAAPAAPEALVGGQMPSTTPNGGTSAAATGGGVGLAAAGVGGGAAPSAGADSDAAPRGGAEVGGGLPLASRLSGGAMPGVGAAAAGTSSGSAGGASTTAATGPGPAGNGSSAAALGPGPAAVGSVPAVGTAAAGPAGTQKVPKVFLYPRNGQSADQQARDRYDCYRFAVSQSGFDPMRAGPNPPPASEPQSDFERAQSACFEGRGYSNR